VYPKLSNDETKDTNEETDKSCTECKKKDIDTKLVKNKNITKARLKNSQYICNECYKERQDRYRQERWAEYKAIKIENMTNEFTNEWNDTQFKNEQNLVRKVVFTFDKFGRRIAEKGLIRDVICKVIFPKLWFVEADKIVNDMLEKKQLTTSVKLEHKQVLLKYIPEHMDLYYETYRNQAREKWNCLVIAANKYFEGVEKLIGTPRWEDPFTHLKEPRWRLLSDRETKIIRDTVKDNTIKSIEESKAKEDAIIEWQEQKELDREKTINESNATKADETN
jgi:hypothetical protein